MTLQDRESDFVPEVNEAFVKGKCDFLVDTQLWPLHQRLDPHGWLGNFGNDERPFAVHLLNSFMYFSNVLLDQLFVSAFRGLSRHVTTAKSRSARIQEWKTFLADVIVTFPTGETPSNADSGYLFARRSRDLVGIDENRILSPDKALYELEVGNAKHIVFVDDFVGSGVQFRKTWYRRHLALGVSFATRTRTATKTTCDAKIFYIPLFCTSFALENTLLPLLTDVRFLPVHILSDRYSALSDKSLFWPESIKKDAPAFIERKSIELGLPDTGSTLPEDWRGFAGLGLGIAFEHQIPDASLPLFYTTRNSWCPLWRKTP